VSRVPGRAAPASVSIRFLPAATIAAVGVGVYLNSRSIPFLWDDLPAIVSNQSIRSLFTSFAPPLETPVAGRPAVNVSFALNYAMGELNVAGYRWVNIGIHVLCAVLLYAIVRRTLLGARLAPLLERGASVIALASALIWLVHPLQSEAVDYVTQRTESIMGLFLLLTLYAVVRAKESARPAWWQAAAVLACALGMASKASMAAAPIVVLLYDRAFHYDSFLAALRDRRGLYLGLAATWLVLGGLMWSAPRSTIGPSESVSWQSYALNQIPIVVRYLRLAVWPRGLVLDYGLPQALTVREVWPQALLITLLAICGVASWLRSPAAGFPGAVFFIMLAPTSSVIPITTEVGAERRMYVPMMALVVLAIAAGWLLLEHLRNRRPAASRQLTAAFAVAAVGGISGLAAATMARNALFQDPVALWRDVVDQRPHGRARISLASALITAGIESEAVSELRLAAPDYPEAKYALGSALFATGHLEEAAAVLSEYVALHPSDPSRIPARSQLGRILASQQRHGEAARQFRAILEVDPTNGDAREGLGDQLLLLNQYDEAAAEYERAATQRDRPDLELKRGMADMGANRLDESIRRFERVLTLDPRSSRAHRYLAEIAWKRGDINETVRHAQAALALDAADASTHNLLGVALANAGRLAEALGHFQAAARIDPSDVRTRENLARAERDLAR